MGPVEAVSPAISDQAPVAGSSRPRGGMRVGAFSLRQIVGAAVAEAEGEAIRRALAVTRGNKSQAARLLRTNYTTLHAKMRRYGIPGRASQL